MGMSSAPPSKTTQVTEAPAYLQPYLKQIGSQAQNIYQPGITPETQSAINQAQALAPMSQANLENIQGTAQGNYLYGGPGFNAALDAATRRIMPQIQSGFARAGRGGSGLEHTAETQALADAFASQYGQERGMQQQAQMALPGLAQQQGQYGINLSQLPQQVQFGNLGQYANIINQLNKGGTTTQNQANYQNQGAGALGGALGGAQLGSMLGPVGTGIGAGLGGLLGLFSDRRLKKDIKKIGKSHGLNVYTFKYKNEQKEHVGFMADEVEKLYPNAISMENGYKLVNYSMIGA